MTVSLIHGGTRTTRQTVQLLSINTWKCDGDYQNRIDLLQHGIKKLRPDIVCCQEVFQSEDMHHDTGRFLSEQLEMQFRFVPARRKKRRLNDRNVDSFSGLAILSRWKFGWERSLRLPTHPPDGDRIAQFAAIKKGNRSILVINTHLSHLKNAANLRIEQLKTILEQPILSHFSDTIFLCGDFNATPESPEIRFLLDQSDYGITDACAAGGIPKGASTYPSNYRNGGGKAVRKRIDHIFLLSPAANKRPPIHEARIVLDEVSPKGVYASDHCGVMVEAAI
jgi:endonuclease/exonuclease/phosphatase family metal-dependent hydrolase